MDCCRLTPRLVRGRFKVRYKYTGTVANGLCSDHHRHTEKVHGGHQCKRLSVVATKTCRFVPETRFLTL